MRDPPYEPEPERERAAGGRTARLRFRHATAQRSRGLDRDRVRMPPDRRPADDQARTGRVRGTSRAGHPPACAVRYTKGMIGLRLDGERVTLRGLTAADVPRLVEIRRQPEI